MRHGALLGMALATALSASAFAGQGGPDASSDHRSGHAHHRLDHRETFGAAAALAQAAPPAYTLGSPGTGPYPSDDQGDVDGLSRNREDCNKGCIDGPF